MDIGGLAPMHMSANAYKDDDCVSPPRSMFVREMGRAGAPTRRIIMSRAIGELNHCSNEALEILCRKS